jgi:hypothetical protein
MSRDFNCVAFSVTNSPWEANTPQSSKETEDGCVPGCTNILEICTTSIIRAMCHASLHGATTQKTAIFIVTAVGTSSHTYSRNSLSLRNPKVYFGVHKSRPPVHILSQINPIHTLAPYSSTLSVPGGFPVQCMHISFHPCNLHALPISCFLISSF